MHSFIRNCVKMWSPCVLPASLLNPLHVRLSLSTFWCLSSFQTRVNRHFWERSKWSGERKGEAHSGSSCATTLVITEETGPNARPPCQSRRRAKNQRDRAELFDCVGVNVISKGKYRGLEKKVQEDSSYICRLTGEVKYEE